MHNSQIRLHILAVPYTITTDEYSHDAYAGKVKRFSPMMRSRGFEVYHYGIETSDSGATKDIDLMTKDEWTKLRIETFQFLEPGLSLEDATKKHYDPKQPIGVLWHLSSPLIVEFNRRLKIKLKENYRNGRTDIVCLPQGITHDPAIKDMKYTLIETGIGYTNLNTHTDFKIFESYCWMSRLLGSSNRSPSNYWFVIPNYFDSNEFKLTLNPCVNNVKRVAFLGRLDACKGCNIIVEIARRFPDVLFTLCGSGDASPFLKEKNIEYREPIHGAERSEYLGDCIAVLCPSKFLEPFCGVAVEAQICGTPAITSDWGGMAETVEQFKTGLRCHTLADYCLGIQMALDGKFDRAYIRERAVRMFDMYNLAYNYEQVFRSVLDV
ncbi:MAG: glycosyltransferase family 1 protein, partial [Bacteroidetes bacterium]|nr:glycosyltransferase family 1 protein [Bacteroidota bacterium]